MEKRNIAYLGPEGSFTFECASYNFENENLIAVHNIADVFDKVKDDVVEIGIVPIENSIHGKVIETIENLKKYDLKIVGETKLEIHNQLCSVETDLKSIKKIYSKDVAYNQCKFFLKKNNLQDVSFVPVESTSMAANIVAVESNVAAICSKVAAKKYNLNILGYDIEDTKNNETRFIFLSKNEVVNTLNNKISLILKLKNEPGSLFNFLKIFHENNINMTSIESRPDREDKNFTYWFYIEIEANVNNPKIKELLHNKQVKYLGNY
jgi:chorismate mutase/prephenate dehydratase